LLPFSIMLAGGATSNKIKIPSSEHNTAAAKPRRRSQWQGKMAVLPGGEELMGSTSARRTKL
jgi:hypothetical protein